MIDDATIADHLSRLCKPPGSLGQLERLAARLCHTQNTLAPNARPRRLVVFAADHGVVRQGVSAWPAAVTAAVTGVMATGRTASGVMSRACATEYRVVDVGCLQPPEVDRLDRETARRFLDAPVRRGTRDLACESAMNRAEFESAWEVGATEAERACADGVRVMAGGEMGIGNTTAAACLACLLAEVPVAEAVGRGAGIDDEGLAVKQRVVQAAAERAAPLVERQDWPAVGAAVGGLEIAALAGLYAAAARRQMTIVVDGYIATAAAVLAERVAPGTSAQMIAAHCSAEAGHRPLLEALRLDPVLHLGMRLGEGTGALALMPLLDMAEAIVCDMASLDELAATTGRAASPDPRSTS